MKASAKTRSYSIQIDQMLSQVKEVNEEMHHDELTHEELQTGLNQVT